MEYRRKPRWFDMEQEWIAKGKPPVYIPIAREWVFTPRPLWLDKGEYRFKEVSRHAALKAEWEAKGKPKLQVKSTVAPFLWMDKHPNDNEWRDEEEYRIKPTPHPDADVLRALADDGSLDVCISIYNGELSFTSTGLTK